jgi:hypothetical protein
MCHQSLSIDAVDPKLCRVFVGLLPSHVYQLVRLCKIKATSSRKEGRQVILLARDRHFAQVLLKQSELKDTARSLKVKLRVAYPSPR